jgi:hypothetical protein
MNSTTAVITPTSSTRPSFDVPPSSTTSSPNPNAAHTLPAITTTSAPGANTSTSKRASRAALREYYNLKKTNPSVEITDSSASTSADPIEAELNSTSFDASEFVSRTLATSSLAELVGTYARVVGEMRALDAEKKALVYDNYSKLIAATETIRRMRSTMDPLNPMAGTLDLVVANIYEQANGVREGLRREVGAPPGGGKEDQRRARTRELAREVLEVPGRLRRLMEQGKEEEARKEWEMPRRLLERWRERGLGGKDVVALIEEGDGIVSGESESGSESEASTT